MEHREPDVGSQADTAWEPLKLRQPRTKAFLTPDQLFRFHMLANRNPRTFKERNMRFDLRDSLFKQVLALADVPSLEEGVDRTTDEPVGWARASILSVLEGKEPRHAVIQEFYVSRLVRAEPVERFMITALQGRVRRTYKTLSGLDVHVAQGDPRAELYKEYGFSEADEGLLSWLS